MIRANSVISRLVKKRTRQIEFFIKRPYEVQDKIFKQLINTAKNTEWGKKYDYKNIKTQDEYKRSVPINDYETLQPWVNRLMKGEKNLLWPGKIKWFAKSSGTTNDKSKFIPVSKEALEECHIKGGKDLIAIYCNNYPDTSLFRGKTLGMGGSISISPVNNRVCYGDLSAILMQNLPFWAESKRIPGLSIALMKEWESKIEMIASSAMNSNVTCIIGVPSWTLVLLKKILDITGKKNISEVWPDLEVFFHGGVNFGPYRELYKSIIPSNKMHYVNNYNASEGFFGIQDLTDTDDLLLMLDYGIFYEFIPLENLNSFNNDSVSLADVKTDVNYAMVISTNAGLWRYIIGDTVRFTSLDPYRITISGRTRNFINAVGEELIVENADRAITLACEKSGAIISEYTAAPAYFENTKNVVHEWYIEFEKEPDDIEFFTEIFDNALKSQNSDYEAKRYRDLVLDKPKIISLPKGTFYKWLKTKGKLGGQYKVPRLSNDRKIIEEISKLIV